MNMINAILLLVAQVVASGICLAVVYFLLETVLFSIKCHFRGIKCRCGWNLFRTDISALVGDFIGQCIGGPDNGTFKVCMKCGDKIRHF